MAKKTLKVPQNGTQPAATPLDNMFSSVAAPAPVKAPVAPAQKTEDNKARTSFNLDQDIYQKFKVYCVQNGKSISGVIEEAMVNILNGR